MRKSLSSELSEPGLRLLLIGAGVTGDLVARELARAGNGPRLVGFLDDAADKQGRLVSGVPVLGTITDLESVVGIHDVDAVLVTIPSAPGAILRTIAHACRDLGLPVRTMPSIPELLGRSISRSLARPIEAADLLRRAPITCDARPEPYLQGARVVITGAGGSIGTELARQVLRSSPAALMLLGHGENSIYEAQIRLRETGTSVPVEPVICDIRDEAGLQRAFEPFLPDVVFHAAAHKHVPLMEAHVVEAVLNNVVGTRTVLDVSMRTGASRVVFISTDKAVSPSSVMGATKRIGEWVVRRSARATRRPCPVVRFGNVLGSRGSVVPAFEDQIARGGPLMLTHPDASRFFMTIPEAVYLLVRAAGIAERDELYVLDMGDPIRIVDLADDIVRLSGALPGSIPFTFAGLRPGEKLHEALWEPGSAVAPSAAPGVLRVIEPVPELGDADLDRAMTALLATVGRGNAENLRARLFRLVDSLQAVSR